MSKARLVITAVVVEMRPVAEVAARWRRRRHLEVAPRPAPRLTLSPATIHRILTRHGAV